MIGNLKYSILTSEPDTSHKVIVLKQQKVPHINKDLATILDILRGASQTDKCSINNN